jgi:hypothetical protein
MNRREMLTRTLSAAGLLASGQLSYGAGQPYYGGWIDDSIAQANFAATQQYPYLSQQNADIKGSGNGKVVLLYKFFEELAGPLVPHYQEAGTCVADAFGLGIDVLTAVQIIMHGQPERWITKCATELIYAGSRVEVGKGKIRGDGSVGVWAAEFIREWGILLRQPYLDGKYNYTEYSGAVARRLGKTGVPDDLESLCRKHPVKTCAIVRSWEECRDSVANGYPVVLSSDVGFKTTRSGYRRDKDGFLSRSRRSWNHSMVILGIDDNPKRPGGLLINSWGSNWISGPIRHGQPVGSFWADASAINSALEGEDSVALSNYVGYPRVNVDDYKLW